MGQDSTLWNWQEIASVMFGEDSPAVDFLNRKITEQGEDEEVIADEGQVIRMLAEMHLKKTA